ncbi:unnamed protein product, partial [Effrenium voratum]
ARFELCVTQAVALCSGRSRCRKACATTCPPHAFCRRGAAAGPSRCTAEALRVLVDDEATAELLFRAAEQLATPRPALAGVRLGRMVGLSDMFRRVVARTLAQQHAGAFQAACAPLRYALRPVK